MNELSRIEQLGLDLNELTKGTIIPQERLETLLKKKVNSTEYAFQVLSLCQWIMMEKEAIGEPVTVCMKQGGLCVLTDAEASEYNTREFSKGIRKCVSSNRRMSAVDQSSLDVEQKDIHLKRQIRQSRILQGIELGRKNLLPE